MRSRLALSLLVLCAAAAVTGCASTPRASERADYGKTYYIDGAGNWGFGTTTVAKALKRAGYPGSVEAYLWTTSFNPALDQVNRPAARLRAAALSEKIRKYLNTYPDNDVNIIALSAGTGVAIWAVEALPPGMKVNNIVLLGSSLSSTYDMTKALEHIKGRVFVYYSAADPILSGPVRVLGTIDGSFDEPAGLVGLHGPASRRSPAKPSGQSPSRIPAGRIVNIPWRPEYADYGWAGGHTDSTSEPFIRTFVAPHIFRAATPRSARARFSQMRISRPASSTTTPSDNAAPHQSPLAGRP